jgi:hypothetical protein
MSRILSGRAGGPYFARHPLPPHELSVPDLLDQLQNALGATYQ